MTVAKKFQIYGRTAYETPLTFIKEIMVAQSVIDEALAAVNDKGWIELIAVPSDAMRHVTGEPSDG